MKIEDVQEANQAVLRMAAFKQQRYEVEKDSFSIIIGNLYQDARMLEAAKESLINELSRRISIEESYLMELGFEIDED